MQDPRWYAPPPAASWNAAPASEASDVILEPGGFGIRAGAHLIDAVLCTFVAFVAGAVGGIAVAILAGAGIVSGDWVSRIGKVDALSFLLGVVGSLAYRTLAEGLGGASAGKALLGLRVLTERREPCTVPKAIGRSLAYYFDALFFGLVGWSAMSKSPMKQRYGDQWAGTIVIHARSAQGILTRSPIIGIVAGLFGYAAIQFVAVLLKAF